LENIVITAYGHAKVIEKISVKLLSESMGSFFNNPNAIKYCDTINNLETQDEEWTFAKIVSENIQYAMNEFIPFKFDIFLKLNNISIQKILIKVDNKDLILALKGSDKNIIKIREKIFFNMSKRAVLILKEDMAFPSFLKDIIEARENILKTIRYLIKTYEIDFEEIKRIVI
jgi:flagellar motor switch protein FliG